MCCISNQSTQPLFKYYVSKLGGGAGVKACADYADAGGGFSNHWKLAEAILEHSLTSVLQVFVQCCTRVSPVFHQCLTIVLSLFHKCFTSVLPVFYQCFTTSSSVFHQCFTNVSPVFYQWFTSLSTVFYQCLTSISPVFDQCFISVSPVCYYKYFTKLDASLPILLQPSIIAAWFLTVCSALSF